MAIGGGFSKSKSSSSSLDFSLSQQGSQAGSFDTSRSGSEAGGRSSQSIAFEPIFSQLFSNASSRALGATESPAQMLFSGGLNFLDSLQNNAGVDALASRVSGPNDVLQGNLDALQEGLGRLFREEINPAITSEAIGGGTLGGGRQGVAQGQGTRAIAEEFTRGASSLITADQQQRDQAASTLAGLLTEGAGLGLQNLEGLLALGVEGQINLAPLSALSNILGGPTVLSESQDFAKSFSESLGESFSESFGESFSFGKSESKSSSFGANLSISDRRLKTDIQLIGHRKGYKWYSFKYVWGQISEGVMSDEVPSRFVYKHESGFDMVDYGALLNGYC